MAWRIVRQPNGLFARFSDVVDHFTHYDMDEHEVLAVCAGKGMCEISSQEKLQSAVDDILEDGSHGDGGSRWKECLEQIVRCFGEDGLKDIKIN